MIKRLVQKFIPDADNVHDAKVRTAYGTLSGLLGIGFNLLLFAIKLLAGFLSHSISMIADAANNLSDAGSSIVTLIGFRMAGQKADAKHPFGHGRIEYLSGLLVAFVIVIMGFELAKESVQKIMHPEATAFQAVSAVILIIGIAVKLYMFSYNRGFAKKLDSVALQSTASDSRNDCITTGVVLASSAVEYLTGCKIDGWTGLAVAIFIMWSGVQTLMDTINPLLGEEPPADLVQSIGDAAAHTKGVIGVHDLIIHDYGPAKKMMSLHIEVPSDMTLMEAHDIADRLETRFLKEYGIQTVIHVDPIDTKDPETQALREKLAEFLDYLGPGMLYHDFRVIHEKNHKKVLFDVNLPYDITMTDDEVLDYLKKRFHEVDPTIRLVVGVDHYQPE